MNESNTYQAVRTGDTADWRLIGHISSHGMGAWLRHDDPTRELETLFQLNWDTDGESPLEMIENAVYDHPQVLDDFTADIAIEAPKSIWVPSALVDENDDEALRLYNQIYNAAEGDLMSESVDDATCLYNLTPGLNAFLQRTFPGARIHPHLAILVRRFRERSADMPRVYIDIRNGEADIVAFDRTTFLMAATHRWYHPNDIQYHLFNILNVYGLDPASVQVSLSGPRDLKSELLAELRKTIAFVMLTMSPAPGARADMPLAASLLLRH